MYFCKTANEPQFTIKTEMRFAGFTQPTNCPWKFRSGIWHINYSKNIYTRVCRKEQRENVTERIKIWKATGRRILDKSFDALITQYSLGPNADRGNTVWRWANARELDQTEWASPAGMVTGMLIHPTEAPVFGRCRGENIFRGMGGRPSGSFHSATAFI